MTDTVAMWCGESVDALSRERLSEIITKLVKENAGLRDALLAAKAERVHDLAAAARQKRSF